MTTLADMDEFRHGDARRAAHDATERRWREITAASLRAADERDRGEDEKAARENMRILAAIAGILLAAVAVGFLFS